MSSAEHSSSSVREIENMWITMKDGVRLAARMWMPEDAEERPVPAILELIPYRKRDGTSRRDEMMHPWFAAHGYAAIRVDLRGSGDSEGVLEDEYLALEQDDGCDIIEWLGSQSWYSGTVGMIGLSWGGFNGLQIAARRPPALKAIVTVGSTDDRYADDVHYMGGAQLTSNFTWAQTLFSDLTRPPDPLVVGEGWRSMWLNRLENQSCLIGKWLAHPERDAYWRHGSVCEDYDAIRCSVLAVGGWSDSYTNAVPRLIRNLKAPCRAIIGPWAHDYPHTAVPGPQIGFLQECLKWWDYWLKGAQNGAMDAPKLRVYMQERLPAEAGHQHRGGNWFGTEDCAGASPRVFRLSSRKLVRDEAPLTSDEIEVIRSPQTLGWAAGEWCPYGTAGDQPADQGVEDGQSLCFDSDVLDQPVEMFGTPKLILRLASSGREGLVVVRLNEVDDAGRSARITYGILDLTKRAGFDRTVATIPGEFVDAQVSLCDTAYRFSPGCRIRIAISNAYWPTIWPTAEAVSLKLDPQASSLTLPVLARRADSTQEVRFEPAFAAKPCNRTTIVLPEATRELTRNFITGVETLSVRNDEGIVAIDAHGMEFGRTCVERYTIHPDDPGSGRLEAEWVTTTRRDQWNVVTKTEAVMTRSRTAFHLHCKVSAFENGEIVFSREFD